MLPSDLASIHVEIAEQLVEIRGCYVSLMYKLYSHFTKQFIRDQYTYNALGIIELIKRELISKVYSHMAF